MKASSPQVAVRRELGYVVLVFFALPYVAGPNAK